ncbi:uncharacterized protein N7483_009444 [Penicillium malachiteum]|uniref:uncharacterized protein n=1 Tax=Penicillium malachiteum TaxID=1324776 RepID=UPI002546C288|nr:uncharacterized protein N7483_009444 [Penicillium malachiteum]KAJ5721510.1 hypothetical protein N7483_009444 [Penicillium malachiteum]
MVLIRLPRILHSALFHRHRKPKPRPVIRLILPPKSPDIEVASIATTDIWKSPITEPWSDIMEDPKEEANRYSASVYSDHPEKIGLAISDDSSEPSPKWSVVPRNPRPYTIGSDEWVEVNTMNPASPLPSPSLEPKDVSYLEEDDLKLHLDVVVGIFVKVYAIAKILEVAFMGYGVELDMTVGTGLMYWIACAQRKIRTRSLCLLIKWTENLYYACYARLTLDIAAIELCAAFRSEDRSGFICNGTFCLPEASHLYRILLACKDILDYPEFSAHRDETMVTHFQRAYVRVLTDMQKELGHFIADDILGFRRNARSVVSNPESAFSQKWNQIIPGFSEIPAEVVTMLAEKFFTMYPKDVPARDYEPFSFIRFDVDPTPSEDYEAYPQEWVECEMIQYHREAAEARLEGLTLGELRRRDYNSAEMVRTARLRSCICKETCFCAEECSFNVERSCPCAQRQLRTYHCIDRKCIGRGTYLERIDAVALSGFQGLGGLKRENDDSIVALELEWALGIIEIEVRRDRTIGPEVEFVGL